MHEDLLGYLLGALEPDEMQRVAQLLRDNPDARAELARIEEALRPIEENYQPVEPPAPDLVSRTLDALPPLPKPGEAVELEPMHPCVERSNRTESSWMDFATGSVAVGILLGLLLPAIAQGRYESRKAACQSHLRQFGVAMTQYVDRNQYNQLPAVAGSGPEAFAGVYAVRLREAGLLSDPNIRWCPSLNPPESEPSQLVSCREVVDTEQLHRASVGRLSELQRMVGGHYAYSLGVVEDNRLTAPKSSGRTNFAVMSDAPLTTVSENGVRSEQSGHNQLGINVLYEDGHVSFYNIESLGAMLDHPLMNHLNRSEAGVTTDDASLAPSWQPPFDDVRQR